ncbi:GTPase IMAP family member 2-like [Periophthalmus magnuspinnatus]|uniref:GTPase IMAP family member 2-like n=1 Tax=Periophthalmus magnuspinnatus TaxID=409849 RepID=UPI00145A2457|nr:GTPase IMAP family member 2-like [Periophthalmus magnuspinnatus]
MSELRLVLLGNNWSLKASVGNLLLRTTEFTEHDKCVKGKGTIQDKELTVICSSDQQFNDTSKQDLQQFIQDIKDLSSSGPHVFLLVLQPEDFTEEQKHRLESVLESFSEQAFHHSLVLMFRPRAETPGSMEKYMRQTHIRDMISRCRYRYLWMDHTDLHPNDLKEFKHKVLFSRICDMLKENIETQLEQLKETTLWLKICLFAILFLLVSIYIETVIMRHQ